MALEFADRIRRIPVYPAADGYASEGPIAKLASNESPYPPLPAVVEAAAKALSGVHRYPEPKLLSGSNWCDVGFERDPNSNRIVVMAALDTLMKGAAGVEFRLVPQPDAANEHGGHDRHFLCRQLQDVAGIGRRQIMGGLRIAVAHPAAAKIGDQDLSPPRELVREFLEVA